MNWLRLTDTTGVHRKTVGAIVLACLILGLTIVGVPAFAQKEVAAGSFEEADCPMMLPGDVSITCGYLSVPEIHGDANSQTIKLAVAILHSHSDHPQPDPVVHLHGGPGQGDLSRIFGYLNASFRAERDLILVDQRGIVVFAVFVGLHWLRRKSESTRSVLFTSVVAVAGLFVSAWLLTLGFLP